ncbi:hypothetical protein N9W17_01475 [Jannaschia sp.]|nr:hypothetical protein [Jannaschia sp.]
MDRPNGLTEEALLAHLRGQNSPEEAAAIEAAAAEDPSLRAELALMGELKGALGAASEGPDTREFGWRKLEAQITKTAQPARTHLWRIAAVFLGALVLGQGAYITLAPGADPGFRTVSEQAEGVGLGVGFVASAPMGEIQALLRATGARIADGPGAIGLYRLSFETEAARDAARATLVASPLVDLVAEEE